MDSAQQPTPNIAADNAANEAIGWNSLCDQFALAAVRLELQLLETRQRAQLVEEEGSHRIFYYNSLMFGITGQTARLARHFSTLMDDVNAMQAHHDRLQAEKSERVHQIQEYHAQMILEHRSQAEAQAASFANKIEQLRTDERDLRMRVSSLRQEAEESYGMLEKRRNDSLEERRQLEMDLQRLQGEVSNQKYFLDRLNAQVEASKMKLRENERVASEIVTSAHATAGEVHSRRISPPATAAASNSSVNNSHGHNNSNSHGGGGGGVLTPADRFSISHQGGGRASPSPDRHGDSLASGISNVQAVRDMGVDEQFVKYGRTAGTSSPYRAVSALNNSGTMGYGATAAAAGGGAASTSSGNTTPRPGHNMIYSSTGAAATPLNASGGGGGVQPVGLGSSYRYGAGNGSSASQRSPGRQSSPAPGSRSTPGGGGVVFADSQPSQWQMRLMKLQGELKSLKTDLGVQSPSQQQRVGAN